MPGKKENNDKNYSNRELWLKKKKENRPKQVWVTNNNGVTFIPVHA